MALQRPRLGSSRRGRAAWAWAARHTVGGARHDNTRSAPGRPRSGRGAARVPLIRWVAAGGTWPHPAYPRTARPAGGRASQRPRLVRAPVRSGSGETAGANGRRATHMTYAHATGGWGWCPARARARAIRSGTWAGTRAGGP